MKETSNISTTNVTAGSVSNSATSEISRIAVTAFAVTAGLIGFWAVACMVAGMLNSGGPVTLISSLFKSILG